MGAQRSGQALGLTELEQTARRERAEWFQFHRGTENKFAIGSDRPEIRRLVRHAEFVTRMVLLETAIVMGMRSTPRTGAQIRDQFFQLDCGSSDFNPDKNFSVRPSHEQIEIVGMGVMLRLARLDTDVSRQPATLDDESCGRRKLANIFAQKPRRFG